MHWLLPDCCFCMRKPQAASWPQQKLSARSITATPAGRAHLGCKAFSSDVQAQTSQASAGDKHMWGAHIGWSGLKTLLELCADLAV